MYFIAHETNNVTFGPAVKSAEMYTVEKCRHIRRAREARTPRALMRFLINACVHVAMDDRL